jgi:hypothetical protein
MTVWQDISTAPKGVEVLVYSEDDGARWGNSPKVFTAIWDGDTFTDADERQQPHWRKSVAGYDHSEDDFYGDRPFVPTHWQPLPEPPA